MEYNVIFNEDCSTGLKKLPNGCVHTCVTSPPYYGLRDYGVDGQIGLEETPEAYVARLVEVFRDVRRVLRDDATLWLNLGDSYASTTKGSGGAGKSTLGPNKDLQNIEFQKMEPRRFHCDVPAKNLLGIPWRVAFALQADGWYLRQDIIWHKPNPMPESVTDRCTKAHEYIFLLSKSERYYYDAEAVKEKAVQAGRARADKIGGNKGDETHHSPGGVFEGNDSRNRRSVWTVATKPFAEAHFATFPPDLIKPCILAGAPVYGVVLDPFMGAGTTAVTALDLGRMYLGFELNPDYIQIAEKRIKQVAVQPLLLV